MMRTLQEIKSELLSQSHSRQYQINDEIYTMTDAEFDEAIDKKAEMILAYEKYAAEKEAIRQAKISAYQKLGLTEAEIEALLPSPKPAEE